MKKLKPGTMLGGKYELIALAAEGGVATVWRAVVRGAAGFSLPVAVKVIKSELIGRDEYLQMFVEEARIGSELQHQNIIHVHDFGEVERGRYYLVLEWVEGLTLRGFVDRQAEQGQTTHWPMIAIVCSQVLRALAAAHGREKDGQPAPVIHRDVSPENILIGENGVVKLTDFGFARAKDRAATRSTGPGIVKGKVSYLSPEVMKGDGPGIASDVYSVGVVLWEMLVGRKLFEGTPHQIFSEVIRGDIPPLSSLRPDLPEALVLAVHRALDARPQQRFRTADEMANALAIVLRSVTRVPDAFIGKSIREAREARKAR